MAEASAMTEVGNAWIGHDPIAEGRLDHVHQEHVDDQLAHPSDEHGEAHTQPLEHHNVSGPTLAYHTDYASMRGHHNLTDTELAEVHHQHQQLLLQAQQQQAEQEAQHHYEVDPSTTKGGPLSHLDHSHLQHGIVATELHLPSLHDADFDRDRKEKRKVANREAARRMRQRRADQLQVLDANNSELKTELSTMQQQLSHLASHNRELMTENANLKQELLTLRSEMARLGQEHNIVPAEPRQEGY